MQLMSQTRIMKFITHPHMWVSSSKGNEQLQNSLALLTVPQSDHVSHGLVPLDLHLSNKQPFLIVFVRASVIFMSVT